MRAICATITQVSVKIGRAKTRTASRTPSMRPSCESAGTHFRCTAKIRTASEATRNSGTETTRIVPAPTTRS